MLPTIIYIFLVILAVCYYSCSKPKDFPPGPKWYPLIGSFPQFYLLRKKLGYMHLAFEELTRRHGPVLGLKMGKQKIIVISSYELVKKAMLLDDFNGRPNGLFFMVRSLGKKRGILFSDGPNWMQNRRFTMKHLKSFGFGQQVMIEQLNIEVQNLVEFLKEQSKAGPVPMHRAFDIAVLNMLWATFAGHRFEYSDKKCKELLWMVHELFRANDAMGGIISHLPFLRFITPKLSGYSDLMSNLNRLWAYFNDEINEHEATLSEDNPRDLIDAYLMEIKKNSKDKESDFDRENLLILCLDLFLAGSKTTADHLAWLIAFVTLNPQWKTPLKEELDKVVGRDRSPTWEDFSNLPFVEAFVTEVQRYLALAPLGLPHRAMKDTLLSNHLIPKDTIIVLNYHSAHYDNSCWKNPEEFCPQRFLDEEGKFKPNNAYIPFGLGKRRCLGENLARSSLFVFFTNVIHHFNLDVDPEYAKPELTGTDGFIVSPKPYYLKLTERSDT